MIATLVPTSAPERLAGVTDDAATIAARLAAFASDAARCAALITGALKAFARGRASLLDLRVGDAIAGRRGKAFLLLEATIRERATGTVRSTRFVLEFFADDDGPKVLWRMRRRVPPGSLYGFARFVREHRILIHEFPFDYRLEALATASDPAQVRPHLAAMAGDPDLAVVGVDVVRYVPEKRCLLRYNVLVAGRPQVWFGKVYARQGDLASGEVQRALAHVFGHGTAARVPDVVGIVPDLTLVVQRQVEGTPLYDSLRAGTLARSHFAATARALVSMHGAGLGIARQHAWADELAVASLAVARSALSGDARDRAARIVAALARVPVGTATGVVAAHRDFYDKQVLITADGVTLIDFDTACTSYRELDLANFVAHLALRTMQGYLGSERASDYACAFLEAYTAQAVAIDAARYRATLATSCLRLAAVYAMRPLWRHLTPGLVDLAARATRAEQADDPLALTQVLFRPEAAQ